MSWFDKLIENNRVEYKREPKPSHLPKLLAIEAALNERMKNKIEFSKPFLFLNEMPIIFPGTINVIQGQTGVHKSRLAEAICAAVLSDQNQTSKGLNFRKSNLEDVTLIQRGMSKNNFHTPSNRLKFRRELTSKQIHQIFGLLHSSRLAEWSVL